MKWTEGGDSVQVNVGFMQVRGRGLGVIGVCGPRVGEATQEYVHARSKHLPTLIFRAHWLGFPRNFSVELSTDFASFESSWGDQYWDWRGRHESGHANDEGSSEEFELHIGRFEVEAEGSRDRKSVV